MWPNLIPGDILKAEKIEVTDLRPGMIAVFPQSDSEDVIVHRVLKVRNSNSHVVVTSSGDRSGVDGDSRNFEGFHSVLQVTGVLRSGVYRQVSHLTIPLFLSPSAVVRFYCAVVRKLFW